MMCLEYKSLMTVFLTLFVLKNRLFLPNIVAPKKLCSGFDGGESGIGCIGIADAC